MNKLFAGLTFVLGILEQLKASACSNEMLVCQLAKSVRAAPSDRYIAVVSGCSSADDSGVALSRAKA